MGTIRRLQYHHLYKDTIVDFQVKAFVARTKSANLDEEEQNKRTEMKVNLNTLPILITIFQVQ